MKIYAPVKNANGVWASIRFVNGVGETDDPNLIVWFKKNGYKVENQRVEMVPTAPEKEPEMLENTDQPDLNENLRIDDSEYVNINELLEEKDKEPDFESMTPNELREWAKANGFGREIKNIRNKDKLLEIVRR